MTMEALFVGVPVVDLGAATPWYERLFGRPADVVPNEHEVMWRVAGDGWLYVIEDAKRAGHAIVAVSVDDLDRFVAGLGARGITPGPTEAVGDAGRKAVTSDPEGNVIGWIEVAG